VLHFYHLAALDYINTTGILDKAPWSPRFVSPDMITGAAAQSLVTHYVQALTIRRQAHQMGAIFGGRLPAPPTFVPGGCSSQVTTAKISDFRALLAPIRQFINGTYIPDVLAVAKAFPSYYKVGRGCGNLLAYGVFDLNAAGSTKLMKRGR
jgi:hydrogenase large subunit